MHYMVLLAFIPFILCSIRSPPPFYDSLLSDTKILQEELGQESECNSSIEVDDLQASEHSTEVQGERIPSPIYMSIESDDDKGIYRKKRLNKHTKFQCKFNSGNRTNVFTMDVNKRVNRKRFFVKSAFIIFLINGLVGCGFFLTLGCSSNSVNIMEL